MTKWARMLTGVVIEVTDVDPEGRYEPSIEWVEVPDEARPLSKFLDGEWTHPPEPQPVVEERQYSADDVRSALTLAERVKWDNNSSPEIKTVKIELSSPRNKVDTLAVLQLMLAAGDVSQESVDKLFPPELDASTITPSPT